MSTQKALQQLIDLLLQAEDGTQMHRLLQALLTDAELHDIPNRLQITRLLKQGIPQRDIAKQLGVGIATVTRGSKALKNMQDIDFLD